MIVDLFFIFILHWRDSNWKKRKYFSRGVNWSLRYHRGLSSLNIFNDTTEYRARSNPSRIVLNVSCNYYFWKWKQTRTGLYQRKRARTRFEYCLRASNFVGTLNYLWANLSKSVDLRFGISLREMNGENIFMLACVYLHSIPKRNLKKISVVIDGFYRRAGKINTRTNELRNKRRLMKIKERDGGEKLRRDWRPWARSKGIERGGAY